MHFCNNGYLPDGIIINCNILVLCPGIACVSNWNNQDVTEIACVAGGLFDERGKNLTKARANEPRSCAHFPGGFAADLSA